MRMLKLMFVLAAIQLIGIVMDAKAQDGWLNVIPAIQIYRSLPSTGPIPMLPLSDLAIGYCSEDVSWTAVELQNRLGERGVSVYFIGQIPIRPRVFPEHCCGARHILIGLWSDMQECFLLTGEQVFQHTPKPEEYFIYVPLQGDILITASRIRALNYAVTSFWQAVSDQQGPHIAPGIIDDFPTFPTRLIANFDRFGGNGTYPTDRPWYINLSDTLLRVARNVLLYGKGNGLVHAGQTNEYDGGNAFVSNVLERIGMEGRSDVQQPHNHNDRWSNFNFDWHEGIGWSHGASGLHPIYWTRYPSSLGGGAGLFVLKFVFDGRLVPEA